MLQLGGYRGSFISHLIGHENNKQSGNFLWCSWFYGKKCKIITDISFLLDGT